MAVEADLVPLGQQQLGKIALMHRVTGAAASCPNRAVHELASDDGTLVAEEAEVRAGGAKLEFVRGLVRIVATGAFPLLHRGVDELLGYEILMTVVTQLPDVRYWLEFVLAVKDVAEGAVSSGDRPVNELFLPHPGVASVGDARRFLDGAVFVNRLRDPCIVNNNSG